MTKSLGCRQAFPLYDRLVVSFDHSFCLCCYCCSKKAPQIADLQPFVHKNRGNTQVQIVVFRYMRETDLLYFEIVQQLMYQSTTDLFVHHLALILCPTDLSSWRNSQSDLRFQKVGRSILILSHPKSYCRGKQVR